MWRTYYVSRMPRWSRRLRIIIDWTVALFFKNDVVQLDQVRCNAVAGPVARPAGETIPTPEEREPAGQTA